MIYRPGKYNLSDFLLRHPSPTIPQVKRQEELTEKYVNFRIHHVWPTAITLDKVKAETREKKKGCNVASQSSQPLTLTTDYRYIPLLVTRDVNTLSQSLYQSSMYIACD